MASNKTRRKPLLRKVDSMSSSREASEESNAENDVDSLLNSDASDEVLLPSVSASKLGGGAGSGPDSPSALLDSEALGSAASRTQFSSSTSTRTGQPPHPSAAGVGSRHTASAAAPGPRDTTGEESSASTCKLLQIYHLSFTGAHHMKSRRFPPSVQTMVMFRPRRLPLGDTHRTSTRPLQLLPTPPRATATATASHKALASARCSIPRPTTPPSLEPTSLCPPPPPPSVRPPPPLPPARPPQSSPRPTPCGLRGKSAKAQPTLQRPEASFPRSARKSSKSSSRTSSPATSSVPTVRSDSTPSTHPR